MAESVKSAIVSSTYDISVLTPELAADADKAQELVSQARSANTKRAYDACWSRFAAYCERQGIDPRVATSEIVAVYLASRQDLEPSSLSREYSGIAYTLRGLAGGGVWSRKARPHAVAEVLAGAFRTRGAPPARKRPLLQAHFAALRDLNWGQPPWSWRNRAIILLGFAGGFRRSELVALDREDLTLESNTRLRVLVRRSKTDQEGRGHVKAFERSTDWRLCVIHALGEWIRGARIASGPLFRRIYYPSGRVADTRMSAEMVAVIVKRMVRAWNLDESEYSGHSLRAGLVTTAYSQGCDLPSIMAQTGHRSYAQVNAYIRRENPFDNNAGVGIFDRQERAKR
jgi:integrase